MQNLKFKASMLVAATMITFIASCKKKDDINIGKNSNYPAAYVVNGEGSTISVINLSTNTVTDRIMLMGTGNNMIMWPHHISYHAGYLSIGLPGMDFSGGHTGSIAGMKGSLLVVDAVDGDIIKNMELPLMNHNTIYSPDGTEIWVPQMDRTGKVLDYLDAKAHRVVVSFADKKYLQVHPSVEGGKFDLHTTFDKPGVYRDWIQYQSNGKVYAGDFVMNVAEGKAGDMKIEA